MNTLTAETLSPITHNQIPVITTELLAQLYGTETNNIKVNFSRNSDRFVCGKHYFKIEGDELRAMKHEVTQSNSVKIARNVRSLILWTERGAARHAKMLETDQAWEVFEKLEDCYFGQHKNRELPAVGLGPLNIDVLLAIRDDKVAFINQYSPGALMTADEALALLKARGWLVMPREELAGRLMEL
ncbi:ORF6N domain-containing protein [Salmonella enterica subsp. enterica serovar Abaetetuba]|uniref:ORF6N domain-containing protein n=1 Tax=Salmonella enterica TaxID=28901 RepID=UPI000FA5F9FE|nr:ORF6N domain-containing protein [Salmonella enterica]EAA8522153.1 ORF6N domain-containing protein [Salmonella enterica subsp. enterica serovar Give]EAS6892699.1 ORF6N domain-containing protein [Salmonella enterica subsp. enterica serovar Poona]EBV5807037.1 ORF6N domain-containing protein [Salmonella enterica subsp. enterica serovar Abaetetuba]ECX5679589.1 ORF6N domain-containing protein [Salmonella enterica subsp. enterica serovar Newport]EDW1894609.1 ORF6N domain-containing protein [Salmon